MNSKKLAMLLWLAGCSGGLSAYAEPDSNDWSAGYAPVVVQGADKSPGQPEASDALAAPRRLFAGPTRQSAFLPANQAFAFSAIQNDNQLIFSARVAPNHYLYQQKFAVTGSDTVTLGDIRFDQAPVFEQDPAFGRVAVFAQDLTFSVPVQGEGSVTLHWQGCARAGVCYPPEQFKTRVVAVQRTAAEPAALPRQPLGSAETATRSLTKASPSALIPAATEPALAPRQAAKPGVTVTPLGEKPPLVARPLTEQALPHQATADQAVVANPASTVAARASAQPISASVNATMLTNQSLVSDPFGLADHWVLALGLLFLAGLGLAFTPCVLPMLPIVANLVATQHRRSARHGFLLAAGYAIGVSCCYALLGALVASFGHEVNLIGWSQHPVVLIALAGIFSLLALHTFEVFEWHLPAVIRNRMQTIGNYGQSVQWSGHVAGCWVAGFFSALIVSPCLSAPLAGVLLSVSTVGNPWLGAAALFCLGLGLGVPLMILGATEGKLLPKAGSWLNWVRRGFGLLLFAVALVLLNRVFITAWMLWLWAALCLLFALWLWYWAGRASLLTKVLALLAGLWAVVLLVGASLGATNPLRPLALLQASQAEQKNPPVAVIYSLAQLKQYQQQHPRLLVELTADWCMACAIVERELFINNPAPQLQSWTRVKLDITQTSPQSRAILRHLNLFGPPAIALYQQGQLVELILGEPKREEFIDLLQRHP